VRDGKDTVVVNMGPIARCFDCGDGATGKENAWRWARQHAAKTGHCPTVTVTYDVHPEPPITPPTERKEQ
jgi:hypothetical protein